MRNLACLASTLLAVLLAGCGGSPGTGPSPVSLPGGLNLARETAHFLIRYSAADASCIDSVAEHLEANQQRICTDLRAALDFRVVLEIYPNMTALHVGMNAPNAPDWVLGLTNLSGEIKIISPLNPGPGHTFQWVLFCMDHEVAHAVVLRGIGATTLPNWLQEGVASYEGHEIDDAGWAAIEPYVKTDRIPTFTALDTTGSAFVDLGGYFWSYTMVDFAMSEYGRHTLRPWIDNRGSFDSTFGVSAATFREQWIEYLKAHYVSVSAAAPR
jgi:RNA polymerase sigma-70 factor (ECF subfamily)